MIANDIDRSERSDSRASPAVRRLTGVMVI